jgi:hypothetical protein
MRATAMAKAAIERTTSVLALGIEVDLLVFLVRQKRR